MLHIKRGPIRVGVSPISYSTSAATMKTTTLLVSALSALSGLAAAASSSHSSSTTHSSSTSHSASSSASSTSSAAASTSTNGYLTNYSTVTNSTFSFGSHYAVLNLDLINALVGSVAGTTAGDAWINSTATWIDAVNAQDPKPLSIFSRIYFSNVMKPELGPETPFAVVGNSIPGDGTVNDTYTDIYPSFMVNTTSDVVVQKARYYAGAGNQLEEILRSQLIDTVILVRPESPPPPLTLTSPLLSRFSF